MRKRQIIIAILLTMLLAACGSGIPEVTPTLAPTSTPRETEIAEEASPTPIIRLTYTATATTTPSITSVATSTGTPTATSSATSTVTQTLTPSDTPTGTQTPTATPTNTTTSTATATATNSPEPSATPQPTDTPTATVTPLVFVETDTPIPSVTPLPTSTATLTSTSTPMPASSTPMPSNTPNIAATRNAEFQQTLEARATATLVPTFTPVPQASPTNTLPPLDVTSTLITATPGGVALAITQTPILSTPQFATLAPTATVDIPTPFPQQQIPATIEVIDRTTPVFSPPTFDNISIDAFDFNVGGVISFNGQSLGGGVDLFAVNPANSNSYVRTNAQGLPLFVPINGGAERSIGDTPFYDGFYGAVTRPEDNQNFITDIAWSPNGRNFSYIITPPDRPEIDRINGGVWFWSTDAGRSFTLMRDCPTDGYNACSLTLNRHTAHWRSLDVEWSPDSSRALITVLLPDENRQAFAIVEPQYNEAERELPPFYRFDNAQWLDNNRLLISGEIEDRSGSIIGIWNLQSNQYEQTIYDPRPSGQWIADAIAKPNGQIVAVGGDNRNVPYRLYRIANGTATPISQTIGNRPPERIQWAANGSIVVLTVEGQQYALDTNTGASVPFNPNAFNQGSTTGDTGGNTIAPIGQRDPVGGTGNTGTSDLPSGVIAGSRYNAGQQIQLIGGDRNMRQSPDASAPDVGDIYNGEFVTILAGPVIANGLEWWFVSNARNEQAWTSTYFFAQEINFFDQ